MTPPFVPPPPRHRKPTAIIVILAVIAFAFAGCAALVVAASHNSGTRVVSSPPASSKPPKKHSSGDSRTAKIGGWVSSGGVRWSVTKLAATHISQVAAGGHPGDPAVVATVRIANGSTHRLNLSDVQVSARVGSGGRDAEQVVDQEYMGAPDGTLAPGRTVTAQFGFAATDQAELKRVAIEVTPGFEYESGTFEGGI